jgi:predicted nucleic acid-binding protein
MENRKARCGVIGAGWWATYAHIPALLAHPRAELIAIQAASNFRVLRELGVTVRKTIDSVIATRCIESGYDLLHTDRDFDPFAKHLGLRVVI